MIQKTEYVGSAGKNVGKTFSMEKDQLMREALESILCLIGESEPDFCSPYQLRAAIIKECKKGLEIVYREQDSPRPR
jgi:hypothetical protein